MATWKSNNATGKCQRPARPPRAHRRPVCPTHREAFMRPLPAPFDACDKQGTRVNSLSQMRYRTG